MATYRGQLQETRATDPRALPLASPCTFLPTCQQSGSWRLNHRTEDLGFEKCVQGVSYLREPVIGSPFPPASLPPATLSPAGPTCC